MFLVPWVFSTQGKFSPNFKTLCLDCVLLVSQQVVEDRIIIKIFLNHSKQVPTKHSKGA